MAQSKANPWAMRVGIAGLVFLLLGAVAIFSNMDQIDEASSPKKINEAAITGGGAKTVELGNSCYSAVIISDDITNVSLLKMSGSNVADEAIESSNCKTDWTPMDSDGSRFTIIKEWDITEKGEYVLEVECELNCENSTLWLVDATSAQWKLLEQPALVFGGAMCCIGIAFLPFAFILYLSNKNSNGPKVMMVGANGQVIPVTDLTPENIANLQQQQAEKVDNPFADTGIDKSEEFIDGREDVQNGTLLTTEQVFALMKGDVDEAQNRIADPFADYNTLRQPEAKKKITNTKEISSWDEGGSFASTKTSNESDSKKNVKQKISPKKSESKPNAWKDWDEN